MTTLLSLKTDSYNCHHQGDTRLNGNKFCRVIYIYTINKKAYILNTNNNASDW